MLIDNKCNGNKLFLRLMSIIEMEEDLSRKKPLNITQIEIMMGLSKESKL